MISVEVVAAVRERQKIVKLMLEQGATAADALSRANLEKSFPDIDFQRSRLAVWGRQARRDQILRDGDRVEVLRPLTIDPRDARRELAKAGKSMGAGD
jgi:putative ubiquitin-RnfH superfamily antitoxin RatB of RatAB toxin-antitoxin module